MARRVWGSLALSLAEAYPAHEAHHTALMRLSAGIGLDPIT